MLPVSEDARAWLASPRAAIGFLIRNEDQKSRDYANIADRFRPGHADYTYWRKYGLRAPRGSKLHPGEVNGGLGFVR